MASNWDGTYPMYPPPREWTDGTVYYPQPSTSGYFGHQATYYPQQHHSNSANMAQGGYAMNSQQQQPSGNSTSQPSRSHTAEEFFDMFRPSSTGGVPSVNSASGPPQYQSVFMPRMVYRPTQNNPGPTINNNGNNNGNPVGTREWTGQNKHYPDNKQPSAPRRNRTSGTNAPRNGRDRLYRQPRQQYSNGPSVPLQPAVKRNGGWEAKAVVRKDEQVPSASAEEVCDAGDDKGKRHLNKERYQRGRGGGVTKGANNRVNWRKERSNEALDDKSTTASQRERLTDQLYRGTLECLVCYDRILQAERVWSCSNCHHVLHLDCIVKWVNSSTDATAEGEEKGWRCPACRNVAKHIPTEYRCMCGKVKNPAWVRGETPHTCGRVCGRKNGCSHACTLLCHPGPCPQCCANVQRSCGCGKTTKTVLCSSTIYVGCDSICERPLNCGVHVCKNNCHPGDCGECERNIHQDCYCGDSSRDLKCDGSTVPPEMGGPTSYSCGRICSASLSCGKHKCTTPCHPPPCPPCPLTPSLLTTCQCGAAVVPEGLRNSCEDPVYVCGGVCGKKLHCGNKKSDSNDRHLCKAPCHSGPCPPCSGKTSVVCRCGLITKEVDCKDLTGNPDDILCGKRCVKKRSCGKHKCNQPCCVETEHICPLPCNKMLQCSVHRCDRLCHRGHCTPCLVASFEELHCECGKSVRQPPVPCGSRPPECSELCSREHPCGHIPTHNCHSLPECPPCTMLTTRYCHGAHEMRKTVPCHMGEYSCGLPCGRPLPCGHRCSRPCHVPPCSTSCTQPCVTPRTTCSHVCAAPCHFGAPCPSQPCLASLTVTCECGRRRCSRTCSENSSDYKRIQTSLLAAKMADVRLGKSVDTLDVSTIASKMSLKTLECNDECKLYERNLRLAIGLQIANPDLSLKLHPRYSELLKSWVRKDRRFVEMVHDQLTQLVQLAKTSKQRSRAHSFPSMGSAKRAFVHEYCEHFGVESVAYDPEPNRNIVATAFKDKCWLPSYSLLEVVDRESGHRKVPTLLPSLKKDISLAEKIKLATTFKPRLVQPSKDQPPPQT